MSRPQMEALRMEHIKKVYPNGVVANHDITLAVNRGEIHALSGENGAGKSTLMKILFGEETQTEGRILLDGKPVSITSPAMAIRYGIGMVHQHFMLVPSLTVVENMILGVEPVRSGAFIDKGLAEARVREISEKYNLIVPVNKPVQELSVGQKQKVEILKALFRGVSILILDEPTAVLTPQETRELFTELKALKQAGYTIIFISHKLREVKELCDRITIIRAGRTIGMYDVGSITEEEISSIMVGREVSLVLEKKPARVGETILSLQNLMVVNNEGELKVNDVSLSIKRGEIFGVAGIEGNGQQEFVDAVTGSMDYQRGCVVFKGRNMKGLSPDAIRALGIGYIPADRMTMGIAPNMSIADNICADKLGRRSAVRGLCARFGGLRMKAIGRYAEKMIGKYSVLCKNPDVPVASLSGGNMQKVVLARELSADPDFIVANQPTRGVDVGATELIKQQLIAMRDEGRSVLLISSDLGELLALADRMVVFLDGKVVAYMKRMEEVTEDVLGKYMLGLERQGMEMIMRAFYD